MLTNKEVKKKQISFHVDLCIFFLSLAYRIIKLILSPLLLRDSTLYLSLSQKWLESDSYQLILEDGTIVPPLSIFLIKELTRCGFSAEIAGRSIALFLGALIPVLGNELSFELFQDKKVSLICSLLLILHPSLVDYSIQPIRENCYLFFSLLAMVVLFSRRCRKMVFYWAFTGFLLTLAVLCRYEALELIVLVPVYMIYLFYRHSRKKGFLLSFFAYLFGLTATFIFAIIYLKIDTTFLRRIPGYIFF